MTTISANQTAGINLSAGAYSNPLIIDHSATITNAGYPDGVYTKPKSTTSFTVQNSGTVIGAATSLGSGVYLSAGGSVTNSASASISAFNGVQISAGIGNVYNEGEITGDGYPSGIGVYLAEGGTVTNAASASISGSKNAIKITGGAGTIVNNGSIYDSGLARAFAAYVLIGSVDNAPSAVINAYCCPVYAGDGATVLNQGTLEGTAIVQTGDGPVPSGQGIWLGRDEGSAGVATNAASGLISGTQYGVDMVSYGGMLTNAGTVIGGRDGISMRAGLVENTASGLIEGGYAGISTWTENGGTVFNFGTIVGTTGVGVSLGGNVTVENAGTIIGDGEGVSLSGNVTLKNVGTIIGNSGTAVEFAGTTGSNLLVLDPGFGFKGLVVGNDSASNEIELASAATAGTLTGLGSVFQHFGSIDFDPGAQWFVEGIQRGFSGPITGFAYGDTIELQGVTATGSSFAGGVLTLEETSGSATLNLSGTFAPSNFAITNVPAGVDVTLACFAAGTRVLTDAGEVPVEQLRVGHRVATLNACAVAPIIWIGHRRVDCDRISTKDNVQPVRVSAGAFGIGQPCRDLLLSPDHAVWLDGALVPIRYLINGTTVVQETVEEITYYHVELAAHDVMLAEELPCESYLDTGNRAAFASDVVAAEPPPLARIAT